MRLSSLVKNLQLGSSESPVYRQGVNAVERLNTTASRPIWLVGGELCLFIHLPLVSIPLKHRDDYIAQQILTRSPFKDTASHFEIVGDVAQIWLWDKTRQQKAALKLDAVGESRIGEVLVIPEHLLLVTEPDGLYQREISSEVVLLEKWANACLESVQTTSLKSLEQSKILFSRSVNVPAESGLQPSSDASQESSAGQQWRWQRVESQYLSQPRHMPLWWEKESLIRPKNVALILGSLCFWGLLFVFGSWLGWGAAVSAAQESLEDVMQQAEPQLLARDRYIQLQAHNDGRVDLLRVPSPLAVMAEFEFLVGEQYESILEWRQERSKLAATIEGTSVSGRRLLEALQQSPLFTNVKVEPSVQPDAIVVEASLVEVTADSLLFERETDA